MAQLFGFQITRASKDKGEQPSFVLPDPEDGATTSAGFYSEFIDIEGQTKSESDLIEGIGQLQNIPNVISQSKILSMNR